MVEPLTVRTGDYGFWKVIVAEERREVEAGKPCELEVAKFRLPPHTVITPLSVARHAICCLLDVRTTSGRKIEEEKFVSRAVLLPFRDGVIEEGDVVGVIRVITTDSQSLEIGELEANIVYGDGEIVRKRARLREGWYRRWNIGEWFPVVSSERREVERGKVCLLNVKPVELPENTIVSPLSTTYNALGKLVDVLSPGKPKRIEERRVVSRAVFLPFFDGVIEEGDLLGVLNAYYVSVGDYAINVFKYVLGIGYANIVYTRGGAFERERIKLTPLMFRRSKIWSFQPVVAAENVRLEEGFGLVKIEPLEFPAGTVIQPVFGWGRGYYLLDLYGNPKPIEEDRKFEKVAVIATEDAEIVRGEVIGSVAAYNVSILPEPELFVARLQR
ncbi:MAG: DUF22 domain-containing protein [Archaeoglobaceae archaeon]